MGTSTAANTFIRTRLTWQAYLLIGYYVYLLNSLGPVTPFLREEMNLSYTQASLHFSAYAVGIIVTGLVLNRAARLFGTHRLMWSGAAGMAAGALLLAAGRHPVVTVPGAFLMGFMGVFLVGLVNSALADEQREKSAIAFTESSMFGSLISAMAPAAIGFFARTSLTWRAGLGLMICMLPILWIVFGRNPLPEMDTARPVKGDASQEKGADLPRIYWIFWFAVLLATAIEVCMLFWAADYLETVSGLAKPDAALALTGFLGATLVGRGLSSRLLRRFSENQLVLTSLVVAAVGFGLFWLVPAPLPAVTGLTIAGLGIAGLFPILNAQALVYVPGRMVEASGRISLAIGLAILLLPMLLGRLADWAGIRAGYGVVAALILLAIVTVMISRREARKFNR